MQNDILGFRSYHFAYSKTIARKEERVNMTFKVEVSKESDLEEIVDIYNWAIVNTSATFDTEVKTSESQLSWYQAHDSNYPIFVARNDTHIIGWGSISRWSDRCAYSGTGEISFYVHVDYQGQGIGNNILETLIDHGKKTGFRTLVSKRAGKSDVSIHLHKKLGFVDIGTMKNVGKKFGEIIDVHLMQFLF
jgi:phosphinothricin acetyltransferase